MTELLEAKHFRYALHEKSIENHSAFRSNVFTTGMRCRQWTSGSLYLSHKFAKKKQKTFSFESIENRYGVSLLTLLFKKCKVIGFVVTFLLKSV